MKWRVLKWQAGPRDEDEAWYERDEMFESESNYWLGSASDVAQALGERHGSGTFLLLSESGDRFQKVTVGERKQFFQVEASPVLEPVE